ncbi:hypothetical protein CMI47_09605 [Candidatus Pacearchaeota archaeon]|nr:hypothetical protein [Candidatus Pacearchaeota archaeon]
MSNNDEWVGLGALAGVGALLYASSARASLPPMEQRSVGGRLPEVGVAVDEYGLFRKNVGVRMAQRAALKRRERSNAWMMINLPECERNQLIHLLKSMGRDPQYLAPVMASADRDMNIWQWKDMRDGSTFTHAGTAWSFQP